MILIIDFGGQTAHLISRRIRDLGQDAQLVLPEDAESFLHKSKVSGIILSGGPMSVYDKNAPTIDPKIFTLGIPVLGICYGFHLTAHLLGGKVVSGHKEYGPAVLRINDKGLKIKITEGLPKKFTVWMNHGDEIVSLPKDFDVVGETEHVPFTFSVSKKRNIYGILFHPEVEHTEYGEQILKNFVEICQQYFIFCHSREGGNPAQQKYESKIFSQTNPEHMIAKIREVVGSSRVFGAVSGGVDSTVAAVLTAKAVGKKFIPIFVNNGLMRLDAKESVIKLAKEYGLNPIIVECEKEMLVKLKGITDPEEKRKVIGNFYIEIFERELEKLIRHSGDHRDSRILSDAFLLQGTIYSDVIESQGTKYSSKIKSHHNVGGLPENLKFKLLEPLREFYKDEVKALGQKLGLNKEFIFKQPFPGPGFAVRIRGEVTEKRLAQEKHADAIVLEELKKSDWLSKVFISFPVMTGSYSTAVKGDGNFFGEVIALRVVESKDIMTASWAKLPYDLLQIISSRIVNEVPEISRVVYDISTKPPATMEWE